MRDGNPPLGWPLERDPYWLETSVAGVFVAGDVRHGSVKRIASATGEGAMAVQLIHGHLAAPSPRRVGWAAAPEEHIALLRSSSIFANLADRDLELLAELAIPWTYRVTSSLLKKVGKATRFTWCWMGSSKSLPIAMVAMCG